MEKNKKMDSAGVMDDKSKGKTVWSLITAFVILGTTMGYLILYKPVTVPLKQPLNVFPSVIGEWVGRENGSEGSLLKEVNTKDHLDMVYQNDKGDKIILSIRYFSIQDPEQKIVGYKTDGLHEEAHTITIPTDKGQMEVNTALARKDGAQSALFFWYDINGRIMTNRYKAKMASFLDASLKRRTNGAIVVISNSQSSLSTSSQNDFLKKSIPIIHDFLKTD